MLSKILTTLFLSAILCFAKQRDICYENGLFIIESLQNCSLSDNNNNGYFYVCNNGYVSIFKSGTFVYSLSKHNGTMTLIVSNDYDYCSLDIVDEFGVEIISGSTGTSPNKRKLYPMFKDKFMSSHKTTDSSVYDNQPVMSVYGSQKDNRPVSKRKDCPPSWKDPSGFCFSSYFD